VRSGDQDARKKDLNARQKYLRAKQKTPHHHGEYFDNSMRVGAPTSQPTASQTNTTIKQSPQQSPGGSRPDRPLIGGLEPLISGLFFSRSVKLSRAHVLEFFYAIFGSCLVPYRGIVPEHLFLWL